MRYLVDAQLPPALARFLSGLERQAEHVVDIGLAGANDSTIWSQAVSTGAAIITKDDDFVKRHYLIADGPPIVWIRVGNTSNAVLFVWFEKMLPSIESALLSGEKVIEVV